MTEWYFQSARELAWRIRKREISSAELLNQFLSRIEHKNPALNAIVTIDVERARAQARSADETLAKSGPIGPLHGVPMTVKDAFEVSGVRSTGGAKIWSENIPQRDAIVIQRLRSAGAVIVGKTNVPAFCSDWQSYNDIFGTTNNPWDVTKTPGGSSGGSAAALAAGLTPIEIGSDIAGSIRLPSAFCGTFGHKPSHDLVPSRGHIPGPPGTLAVPDLSVVGPMARNVDDLALLLDVIAGPAPEKAKAYRLSLPPPRAATLRGYRVAAWLDDPAFPVDNRVLAPLRAAVDALRRGGVAVDDAHPPIELAAVHAMYRRLIDPITVGGASDKFLPQLEAVAAGPDTNPLTPFAKNALIRHRDWLRLNEQREQLRATLARFFEDYDVLLTPVTFVPPFAHDHSPSQPSRTLQVNGQPRPYMDLMGWICLATAAFHPATVLPVGRTPEGLPVGMQVIAPYLEDRTSIDFAGRLSELIGGFEPPDAYR